MQIIDLLESEVRSYCRFFPTVFSRAQGSRVFDESGKEYIDFFSGAGSLNYGHNNRRLKEKLLEYIAKDGITHSLDMATEAKCEFLDRFQSIILEPRRLDYKIQFPGPTGTNAVEAALKLARKVTGRRYVIHFVHSFHGMTLGALAVTHNSGKRAAAGVPLDYTRSMPFDGPRGAGEDSLERLGNFLDQADRGPETPAAVILETIQAEGGVHVASFEWLERLNALLRRHGVLLIVDDIQVGCGRTGPFFSFEPTQVRPDIVCLSKSISGFGLPMALVLVKPELDIWKPGEHNGTFRGNNLAFVTGAQALAYWQDDTLEHHVGEKAELVRSRLESLVERYPEAFTEVRGRGLIQGLTCAIPGLARQISRTAFTGGLIIETAGPDDEVLKLLPPLVIEDEVLEAGLEIIAQSVEAVLTSAPRQAATGART